MRPARFGLCALIGLGACEDTVSHQGLVPTSVDWLAGATLESTTGALSRSTPLQRSEEPLALARGESDELWLIGFDEESMTPIRNAAASHGAELEDLVQSAPLAAPKPCEDQLPSPTWSARAAPGGAPEAQSVTEAPPLSAPWLDGLCEQMPLSPGLGEEVLSPLSLELGGFYCDRTALIQSGCELSLNFATCNLPEVGATMLSLEWDGRICARSQGPCTARAEESRPPELTVMDCDLGGSRSSELRVHRIAWEATDAFVEAEFVRVIEGALPPTSRHNSVDPFTLHSNYVSAFIELGDELVLSTHPGSRAERNCRGEAATRLVFLDKDSLRITRTATAPDCLVRLAAHPEGGFVGAHDPGDDTLAVARFDSAGRLLYSRPLMEHGEDLRYWLPSLDYLPSIQRFLVVITPSNRGLQNIGSALTRVFLLDHTLDIVSERPMPEVAEQVSIGFVHPVMTPAGPRIVLAEDAEGRYLLTDLELTRIEDQSPLSQIAGGSRRTVAFVQLSDGRMIVSGGGDTPMLGRPFPARNRAVDKEAYQFEAISEVSILAPLPGGLVLALVKPQNVPSDAIFLSRFDPESWRFVPGSPRLRMPDGSDPGPATRSLVDDKGRIWLGFSISPFIARLEPRSRTDAHGLARLIPLSKSGLLVSQMAPPLRTLLIGALVGCGTPERVEITPPSTVSFWGAITLDAEGEAEIASTSMRSRDESLESVIQEGGTTFIVGWDDSALSFLNGRAGALGFDLAGLARSSPLTRARGCAEELPPAVWALRLQHGKEPEDLPADAAPRLRAAWVGSLCEPLPTDAPPEAPLARGFSVESSAAFCPGSALSMVGCAVRFDAHRCGSARMEPIQFRAHPDGRSCFSDGAACRDRSATSDDSEPAQLDFECEEPDSEPEPRRYRVHVNDWAADDTFADVEWVRVIERDIIAPMEDEFSRTIQFASFVTSITQLEDSMLFTTHPTGTAGYRCDDPAHTELVFVDVDRAEVIRTATAAPCLSKVLPDARGGFYGLSRPREGQFVVGRYEVSGRLEAERTIVTIPDADRGWGHWISAFVAVPSGLLAVISTGYFTEAQEARPPTAQNLMVWLSPELEILRVSSVPFPTESAFIAQVLPVETLNGPRLLYTEDYADLIAFGDLQPGSLESSSGLGRSFGAAFRVAVVTPLSSVSFALSIVGPDPVVTEARLSSDGTLAVTRRAHFHEFPADISQAVRLPSGQMFTTAVLRDVASNEVVWTRFDPEAWRFRPGSLRLVPPDGLEPGPATNSLVDSSGGIWLVFSYSHWVARLSPRD